MKEEERESSLTSAFVKVADTLTADFDVVDLLHDLVETCTTLLDVQAGGLMLADAAGTLHLVASTSEEASLVEIMQLNAGIGPCLDCFAKGTPVSVADIARDGSAWPQFQAAAAEQGFRSVYATPMRLRGTGIGTMNLLGTAVGGLGARDAAVAQALTDVATIGILQERMIREHGVVTEQLQRTLDSRVLVEQAKGVISHIGQVGMNDAFTALRRYARENGLTLHFVAEGVVNRSIAVAQDAQLSPRSQ